MPVRHCTCLEPRDGLWVISYDLNERVPESLLYEVGLQVSRGIYTEEEKENDIWSDP